jgi:Mce-associated membrane protein
MTTKTARSDSEHDDVDSTTVAPDQESSESITATTPSPSRRKRRVGDYSINLRSAAVGATIVAMTAALIGLGWQLQDARGELSQSRAAAENLEQAEQVATDYATGAAEMDFRELPAWRGRLTQGTSPELADRLTKASSSMEQIIAPLQWSSTATPIAASAQAGPNGTYLVDCFVSVMTKNTQAPDGIQSTATYKLTIDGRDDWKITEISGIDSALGSGGEPR